MTHQCMSARTSTGEQRTPPVYLPHSLLTKQDRGKAYLENTLDASTPAGRIGIVGNFPRRLHGAPTSREVEGDHERSRARIGHGDGLELSSTHVRAPTKNQEERGSGWNVLHGNGGVA